MSKTLFQPRLPPRPGKRSEVLFAELWAQRYPNTPLPPLPPFLLSLFNEQTAERIFINCILPVLKLEQWKDSLYVNQLFLAGLFFAVAGYSTTFRAYYKDQIWYGLRSSLPGISQVQQQQLGTFQYFTAPTGVELARQLGTAISTAEHYENPAMQFLETPFVNRLDLYPHAAVLHLTPQWTTLVGENYTTALPLYLRKYHRMLRRLRHNFYYRQRGAGVPKGAGVRQSHHSRQDRKRRLFGRGTIPIFQTLSTFHPLEYQPRGLAQSLDSWVNQRFFFDIADEVPTLLQDSFGFDPTYCATPRTIPVTLSQGNTVLSKDSSDRLAEDLAAVNLELLQFQTETVKGGEAFDNFEGTEAYGIPFPLPPKAHLASNPKTNNETTTSSTSALSSDLEEQSDVAEESVTGEDIAHMLDSFSNLSGDYPINSEEQPYPYMDNCLGYSAEQPISQPSWIFEVGGLEEDELAWLWTWDQRPRIKAPKTPVIYSDYKRARYDQTSIGDLSKKVDSISKKASGKVLKKPKAFFAKFVDTSLVSRIPSLRRRQLAKASKERMARSLKRQKLQGYLDSFAGYSRARQAYNLRKGMMMGMDVKRTDAPLRETFNELLRFWEKEFPSFLLNHINHVPVLKQPRSWIRYPDGSQQQMMELKPGALDWYAHRPMARYDWEYVIMNHFHQMLSSSPEPVRRFFLSRMRFNFITGLSPTPFTVKDVSTFVRTLFGTDFETPLYSLREEIRSRIECITGKLTDSEGNNIPEHEVIDDAYSYKQLYEVLASKGLSAGPLSLKEPKDRADRKAYQSCPLPAGFRMSEVQHPNISFLDEPAFYSPIIDWLEGDFFSDGDDSRLPLPKGLEFHWAIHANHLASCEMTTNSFIDAITARDHPNFVPKGRHYRYLLQTHPSKTLAENTLCAKRAEQLRRLLKQQTGAYITALESARLTNRALGMRNMRAVHFLRSVQSIVNSRRLYNELVGLTQAATSMRALSFKSVRSNWYRYQPEMTGFLFPDETGNTPMVRLGSKSWWEAFQAMTSRPMEIFLPAGYRLFSSQTMPDFTRPRPLNYQDVPTFPLYEVDRHPLQLPGYQELKRAYSDLDVSFFPSPPKPELLRKRVFADPPLPLEKEEKEEKEEDEVVKEDEKENGKEKEKEKDETLKEDWSSSEWRAANLPKLSDYPDNIKIQDIGPYPDYFNYSTTLAMHDGELDVSANLLHWIHHYYLGAQNWLKDVPANFFGRAGGTYGEHLPNFRRKIAFEQMRMTPLFIIPDGPYMRDTMQEFRLRIAGAPTTRLPSQLEDGDGLWFLLAPSPRVRARNLIRKIRKHYFFETRPRRNAPELKKDMANEESMNLFKYSPPFKVNSINTLPELSRDEWYRLFHLAIERVRRTGDPEIYLDIPAIRPVIYNRPVSFAGRIHVDPLVLEQKRRTQTLAQILFAASQSYDGGVDIPDYLNPRQFAQVNPSPMSGESRHVLPICWHYVISKSPVSTLPDIDYFPLTRVSKRTFLPHRFQRRVARRHIPVDFDHLLQAENFLRTGDVTKAPYSDSFLRLIGRFYNSILHEAKWFNRGTKKKRFPYLEPLSTHSWFVLFQVFLVLIGVQFCKTFAFILIQNVYLEAHYQIFPFLQSFGLHKKYPKRFSKLAKSVEATYVKMGLVPPRTFRVFKDLPRRFTDIVGIEPEVLIRSAEIVVTLQNPARGGPTASKGVLLYGPPGNGKTFLVQAIAGESHVPLITVTTAELFNKEVHKTPSQGLLKAFSLSYRLRPSILFIDEIDGLGLQRSALLRQAEIEFPNPGRDLLGFMKKVPTQYALPLVSEDPFDQDLVQAQSPEAERRKRSMEGMIDEKRLSFETEDKKFVSEFPFEGYLGPTTAEFSKPLTAAEIEQVAVLTTFLVAMDTIRPSYGMVVIGATNRLSLIDPAIIRDGRLDRHIGINAPSEDRRVEMMRFYLGRLGLQEKLEWDYLADRTRDYSVADLVAMINLSAMTAILRNEKHTLASVEEALAATIRYRAIRADILPFPAVHQLPPADPLFFLRISYYQASRALIHNILPDHPRLPFVQMQIEPFLPDLPMENLLKRPYTLQDLIDRLAAMLSGKAGEYLLLYGAPFASQEELNERQLWESTLGTPELAYAVDLAYAITDQWLLIDDVTVPLRKLLKLVADDNDDLFFEPGGDIGIPHFLRFNLEHITKQHGRLTKLSTSMNDETVRIYSYFTNTLRWFAYTKSTFNFIPEEFNYWKSTLSKNPLKRNLLEPTEQYYSDRPHFKFLERLGCQPAKVSKDPSSQSSVDQSGLDEDMTKVCPRPTLPDLELIDRDYLMFAILVKTFNNVVETLTQHRPIVDRMSKHLRQNQVLRSPEIFKYIREYTVELRAAVPETPVRTDPYKGEILDLNQGPQSRIQDINGRKQIVIDQSWGLNSRKPVGRSIPINVATDGPKSPVWSSQSLDQQKGKGGKRQTSIEYLAAIDMEFQSYKDWYAERYRRVHEYFADEIAQHEAEKNERRDAFVGEALISMVPGMQSYLDRLDRQLQIQEDWGPAPDQEGDGW